MARSARRPGASASGCGPRCRCRGGGRRDRRTDDRTDLAGGRRRCRGTRGAPSRKRGERQHDREAVVASRAQLRRDPLQPRSRGRDGLRRRQRVGARASPGPRRAARDRVRPAHEAQPHLHRGRRPPGRDRVRGRGRRRRRPRGLVHDRDRASLRRRRGGGIARAGGVRPGQVPARHRRGVRARRRAAVRVNPGGWRRRRRRAHRSRSLDPGRASRDRDSDPVSRPGVVLRPGRCQALVRGHGAPHERARAGDVPAGRGPRALAANDAVG